MSLSYRYWNDCADEEDIELMWIDADVRKEWIDAGEKMGQKVFISRDPDGLPFITQVELRAVTRIVVNRHFDSQLDPDMLYAIAEIASGRQILAENYERKKKQTMLGLMQIAPEIAEWLVREMGYRNYSGIVENPSLLFRPFENIYFGAAYIKWLFCCNGKERTEEFVVRAYKGGIKKATHKSTADYFQQYLSVREDLTPKWEMRMPNNQSTVPNDSLARKPSTSKSGANEGWAYWDIRVSTEDMEEMWQHPDVLMEWTRSGERRGKVRFSHDSEKRPYLSRVEVKAVAEIIVSRYFSSGGMRPTALAAIAEVGSMRFVNGVSARTGLMGIDYPTALWLYKDNGYQAYKVTSVDDLYNPFLSMYFGAAYLAWLSVYEGREQSRQFIVQAYLGGPENVNIQETGPHWTKFLEALRHCENPKRHQGNCCML